MVQPPVARATFNVKWIGITALIALAALLAYMFSAKFIYQETVKAEESMSNSGPGTIERKQFPKGFAEQEPIADPEPVVQQQPQQNQQPAQYHAGSQPPRKEPKPLNFGFGTIEKQDAVGGGSGGITRAAARAAEPEPDLPEYARQGLSGQKRAFARNAGKDRAYVNSMLEPPLSRMMIRRGRIIPAVMTNAPSTEMPGDMFAMVTEDVKDSLTGKCVLIPAGSIVSGEMNDMVEYGASAAQGAWTGISMATDGSWIDLGSMPATNAQGRAGLYGRVNRHNGTMALAILGSATLKLLGQAGQLMDSGGNEVTVYSAGGSAAATSVADPMSEIVTRELNRENTIDMEIGDPAPLLVKQDLYLPAQGDCDV